MGYKNFRFSVYNCLKPANIEMLAASFAYSLEPQNLDLRLIRFDARYMFPFISTTFTRQF